MPDPMAQPDVRVAGEFSNIQVDQLHLHPNVPLDQASTDVTNQRHQEREQGLFETQISL